MEPLRQAIADLQAPVAVDVLEGAAAYRLDIDLPGATADGTTVTVRDGRLRIRADREPDVPADAVPLQRERPPQLECDLPLPPGVDPAAATATLDRGVLAVELPKTDAAMDRSIPVEDN